MATVLERESKITSQGQTTVPKEVRDVLGVAEGDRLRYSLDDRGRVVLSRAAGDVEDPIIGRFLELLASDLSGNPRQFRDVPAGLLERAQALTAGMEIDLDEPIDGAIDL